MKRLKFAPDLVPLILDGSKTSTWRMFDDKNLSVGDELEFVNAETGDVFAKAKISYVKTTCIANLSEDDRAGHEPFESDKKMLAWFQNAYDKGVTTATPLKIVRFRLTR